MAVVAQTVRWPDNWKLTIPEIKPSHVYELLRAIRVEKRETATTFRTMHHLAGLWGDPKPPAVSLRRARASRVP